MRARGPSHHAHLRLDAAETVVFTLLGLQETGACIWTSSPEAPGWTLAVDAAGV